MLPLISTVEYYLLSEFVFIWFYKIISYLPNLFIRMLLFIASILAKYDVRSWKKYMKYLPPSNTHTYRI